MCGIVGFFSKEEEKGKIIKKMADRINHRGPDQEGYYVDEDIAFGHKRLSIIDVENGIQPMKNESESLIVIFNGELYNYRELKYQLKEKGHKFKTNSDTEILIHGYEEWGDELPKKLRGMFTFAIWDKNIKTLLLVRDNFGIKPLYYYKNDKVFMFASEIKSFLEHPEFKKEINKKLIGPYLSFSFTPTKETLFKEVYLLEPGTKLTFKNNEINIKEYYNVEFNQEKQEYNTAIEKISETMRETVEYHKISDVEVGAFLSGGIDSSYIVSLARPDKTYTVRI